MKPENKKRDTEFDKQSILNTNSAKMTPETVEISEEERKASRKQKLVSLFIFLGVVLFLVAVFVLGGIVSNYQYKKEQAEKAEAARIAALKEPRADTIYITGEEPELTPYQVTWSVVNAYYSNENGMHIVMNFANGHETVVPVEEINVWLHRGDELVASGRLRNIVDLAVPAIGDVDYFFYLDPSLVKIADLKEDEDLTWNVQVTYDLDDEAEALALEKREDSAEVPGEASPELVMDEVTYAVTEAYYTNEAGLYVTVAFANGTAADVSLKTVDVVLYDTAQDSADGVMASGESTVDKVIPANGTLSHTFYIAPEDVVVSALAEGVTHGWEINYTTE